MFDIGWSEMLLVGLVAIVVIGPQELPAALYGIGKIFKKFRKFSSDIQKSLDEILHEEELNEIIREANKPGGDNLQFEIDRQYELEQQARAKNEEKSSNA